MITKNALGIVTLLAGITSLMFIATSQWAMSGPVVIQSMVAWSLSHSRPRHA
jgi:hypothetical protein